MSSAKTSTAIGAWGEDIAIQILAADGYNIHARNVHSRYGEIDIVAEREGILVFIEVKLRKAAGAFGAPEESFTPQKQERLLKTIWGYLQTTYPNPENICWHCHLLALEINTRHQLIRHTLYKHVLQG